MFFYLFIYLLFAWLLTYWCSWRNSQSSENAKDPRRKGILFIMWTSIYSRPQGRGHFKGDMWHFSDTYMFDTPCYVSIINESDTLFATSPINLRTYYQFITILYKLEKYHLSGLTNKTLSGVPWWSSNLKYISVLFTWDVNLWPNGLYWHSNRYGYT